MNTPAPSLFINRELSWLAFNERVLEEAKDASVPVLERLRFLAIAYSNLDEFFMVRVAGLKQQIVAGVSEAPADGMSPSEQLAAISDRAHRMVDDLHLCWRQDIAPLLASHGVSLLTWAALEPAQRAHAKEHFRSSIFPALTPLAVDPGHPFPHLRNKSLNLAVLLRRDGQKRKRRETQESSLAVVQVPSVLSRLVRVTPGDGVSAFILLEDLIAAHAGELFDGYTVQQTTAFRVTRNWDLNFDEEDAEDLLSFVQAELRRRDRGAAVRLELAEGATAAIEDRLERALRLDSKSDIYRVNGPLQISDLLRLTDLDARPELRFESFQPAVPPALAEAESMFSVLDARDVLLHHPYEGFDPVVRFLNDAAEDPNVLAIKQTLYRTSSDSPIARALSRAVENGKQVTVLVEIKARLDEANNIAWARRMEEEGVHVVYGLVGLKTHCKVALIVRRNGDGIRRYVHFGTGNYNPNTARQYTDLSFFTAREDLATDVTALFNMLTGYSVAPAWKRLAVAPFTLQSRLVQLIGAEADAARQGAPARVVAKLNALVDPVVIRALYDASAAGVEIDLLVRGICCLRPGVPGVSDRIRVTSIVDRFLEHSRIFAFGAGERTQVYCASADWMPRNFLRRVEVMFPIDEPALRSRFVDEILGVALRDNVKARRLGADGTYARLPTDGDLVRSQVSLLEAARRAEQLQTLEVLRHAAAPELGVEAVRTAPTTEVPR